MRAPTVHVFGTVYFDLVFSDLSAPPRPGTEVRTGRFGLSPGGSANIAVALARLGVGVRLSAPIADDAFGQFLWAALEHEGVDLTGSPRLSGWATPLTVSLAYGHERSLVTYEELDPLGQAKLLHNLVPAEGTEDACFVSLTGLEKGWLEEARARFAWCFADVGWDPTERWTEDLLQELALVDVFLPNAAEAMAYARQTSAAPAAAALAEHVPLAVVKCGAKGAVAAGAELASPLSVGALAVEAVDTTGAGDVFDAGFIYGCLAGWPIEQRLRFANLCAGESVRYPGGSLSAPCWRDLRAWWERQEEPDTIGAYTFLPELFQSCPLGQVCQRPCASMPLPRG